jgi:hypothetical protein
MGFSYEQSNAKKIAKGLDSLLKEGVITKDELKKVK